MHAFRYFPMSDMQETEALADGVKRKPAGGTPDHKPPIAEIGLGTSVQYVKGVGPKRFKLLERCGILTLEDLLYYSPLRYEDRCDVTPICRLNVDENAVVRGTIIATQWKGPRYGSKSRIEAFVRDETEQITAVWFNASEHLYKRLIRGHRIILYGKVGCYRWLQMVNPTFTTAETDEGLDKFRAIVPIYPLTEGLRQGELCRIIIPAAQTYANLVEEVVPASVRQANNLLPVQEALKTVHAPPTIEAGDTARRRLIYDEFFVFQTAMAVRKRITGLASGISFRIGPNVDKRIRARFPFTPTAAQERAVREIADDMRSDHPMSRLLQGDVGCGKTLVAAYAMLAALAERAKGRQVAVMAPTEILAEQHFLFLRRLLESAQVRLMLLTGSQSASERKQNLDAILNGDVDLIVGTHALIQEDVEFKNLGLIVIDEQHRFGVAQRHNLGRKGPAPDVLLLTATPIPRTLALTLYGEVDVSIIDEMPPGRAPVRTLLFDSSEEDRAWEAIRQQVAQGHQAFVVYPVIDESDKLDIKGATSEAERLQSGPLASARVCLLHGRMKQEQKDAVMEQFRKRNYDVMVATTVIEVGIDVPNATVMVINHAERLGLAQLHQLRGRVGRAQFPSYCILLAESAGPDAAARLRTLTKTNDGFKIAEEDLRLRGPGEFLGTRQSGLPEFLIGNIVDDREIMETARRDAFALVASDPRLALPEHSVLRRRVLDRYGKRLDIVSIA